MSSDVKRAAVLVSGGGSNLGAILDAQKAGRLTHTKVEVVISSKPGVYALERAKQHGVPAVVVEKGAEAPLLQALSDHRIDLLLLAGYLRKLSPAVIQRFRNRILNIHPALLPKYGGAGLYGHHVHEAVLKAGEKESGCSVHVVDEEFDHGPVLAQSRVPVLPNDTPDTLAQRVLAEEHKLYPRIIEEYSNRHD